MKDIYRRLFFHALDLFLPEECPLCGRPLLGRPDNVPLCLDCRDALSFLAPPFCRSCGLPLTSQIEICGDCRERQKAYDEARSLSFYRGIGREILYLYKGRERAGLAPFWAELLTRFPDYLFGGAVVVPVPCSPSSLKRRGWDQVALVARYLGRRYRVPVRACLRREAESGSQKSLTRRQRLEQGPDLFSLREGMPVPADIVLLDDVMTTGATLEKGAALLKRHGARRVRGLTFLRRI